MTDAITMNHLRERVTLEAASYAPSAGGGQTRSFTLMGIVWANIAALKSETVVVGGQQRRITSYKVTVRRRDDLGAVDRLLWREKTLKVTGLTPHARRGFVVFYCEWDTPA